MSTVKQQSDTTSTSIKSSVLLVDDSEGFRKQLKWVVTGLGYAVTEAGNGKEAIAAVIAGDFSLIIMNLNMPVMNGFEASRKIRELNQFEVMPIIALSAYDSTTAQKAARQAGCNFYFNKLTDIDQLILFLQHFIEQE